MSDSIPITIAYGDGVGPEIMEAALLVLRETGAPLTVDSIEVGSRIYNMDAPSGILPSSLEALRRNRVLLKAPTLLPEGERFEDVTAALCRHFELDMKARRVQHCDFMPGVAAVAHVSEYFALFEPLQEPMVEMKGKDQANPSAMLLAGIMMLEHIGQHDIAALVNDAWKQAIEDGIHTRDIYKRGSSAKKAGTREFAEAVAARLHKNYAGQRRLLQV